MYNLMHKTVPELPHAMLQDLENIKKLFIEEYNKKSQANMAKAATAPKMVEHMPNMRMGEGLIEEPPKRAILLSIASGARTRMGPIPPTIPLSAVGLRRTARQRTSLLSSLTPQRNPGKRRVAGIPVRWLI